MQGTGILEILKFKQSILKQTGNEKYYKENNKLGYGICWRASRLSPFTQPVTALALPPQCCAIEICQFSIA